MKEFKSFLTAEKKNNLISSFYTKSHKRTALLDEMMISKGQRSFRVQKTQDTRWVASHVEAMIKLLEKWQYLLENVSNIFARDDNTEVGKENAEEILDFLKNKHALVTMAFNIDVQSVFKSESLKFQERYSTLIGQSGREGVMKGQLLHLKQLMGISLKKYLSQCKCGASKRRADPCTSLAHYEVSMYVEFRGEQLNEVADENFPRLSSFLDSYIQKLLKQIEDFFPEGGEANKAKLKMSAFDPLDNQKWPVSKYHIPTYTPKSIKDLAKMFGVAYDSNLQDEFNKLITTILKNSLEMDAQHQQGNKNLYVANQLFYCDHRKDDPLLMWTWILEKFGKSMSPKLKLLIRKVLIVPMG